MAIKQLKPYLKNLADAIRNRTIKKNLFNKDATLATFNQYNAPRDTILKTNNGIKFTALSVSNTTSYFYLVLGLAKDYEGKTLTISSTSNSNYNGTCLVINKNSTSLSLIKSGITWKERHGLYSSSLYVPVGSNYTNEVIALKVYVNQISQDNEIFYLDNLMLTESNKPLPYVPYETDYEAINAQDFSNKINEVYDIGFVSGVESFMEKFQDGGFRTNYQCGFANWQSTSYFKPLYDIKPTRCDYLFQVSAMAIDLVEYLDSLGVTLDFSNVNNTAAYAFSYAKFTRVGDINLSKSTQIGSLFAQATNLVTIDGFWLPAYSVQKSYLSGVFSGCKALQNITINNTVYTNINFSSSPLSIESMKSIINHLYDYSKNEEALSVSTYTYTLTLSADCRAALEAEGATAEYTDSEGNTSFITWVELIDNKKWNLA